MHIKHQLGATLVALMVVGGVSTAHAQRNVYFALQGQDTPSTGVAVNGSRITFDSGNLLFASPGEPTATFALADIDKITFSYNPTGVESLEVRADVRIVCDGYTVSAPGWSQARGARIYTMSGQLVYNNAAWNGEAVDITGLTRGIYIFKTSTKTFKFTR